MTEKIGSLEYLSLQSNCVNVRRVEELDNYKNTHITKNTAETGMINSIWSLRTFKLAII